MAELQASTPLNQLPSQGEGVSQDQDNAIVNEILNEIDSQNDNSKTNRAVFERQVDSEANTPQNSVGNPTPEQIKQMNEFNQQNQIQQMQIQQQELEAQAQAQAQAHAQAQAQSKSQELYLKQPVESQVKNSMFSSNNRGILDYLKDSVLVMALLFLFSLTPINKIISKIPKATSSAGGISIIGNGIKAVLAGVIFFVLSKFV